MGRISKGYGIAALVFGILEMIFGIIFFICALVLAGKLSKSFSISEDEPISYFTKINYWWGGAPFILSGILGIVTFFTRNSSVAKCHLIFNSLSLAGAVPCALIAALLYATWSAVVTLYSNGDCITLDSDCICTVSSFTVQLGGSCSLVTSLNSTFMAMAVSASIGTIVILVCCCVSCVSLCNQEQDQTPGLVLSPQEGGIDNQTMPPSNVHPPAYRTHG